MSVSAPSKRLLSLDVLRGMTVFGMILVNNAGGELSYHSLQHSAWNGMTPCDLVFPFSFSSWEYQPILHYVNSSSIHQEKSFARFFAEPSLYCV